MTAFRNPVGVILAGGLSSRMQGPEKTLMSLAGKPVIVHVRDKLRKQVDTVIINANGKAGRFADLQCPVQPDTIAGFAGPLAGILAGMKWCLTNNPEASHILTVAGDTPFFPDDLAERLVAAAQGDPASIAIAYSDGNRHPTFGLWPVKLQQELEDFLIAGDRKVMLFAQGFNLHKVAFPIETRNNEPFDPFFNINTLEDFATAERMVGEHVT